jgi:hypothetical protein
VGEARARPCHCGFSINAIGFESKVVESARNVVGLETNAVGFATNVVGFTSIVVAASTFDSHFGSCERRREMSGEMASGCGVMCNATSNAPVDLNTHSPSVETWREGVV